MNKKMLVNHTNIAIIKITKVRRKTYERKNTI